MDQVRNDRGMVLAAVSRAMVALHKEQMGRGPTKARTSFAGPDAITCVLHDVLLPAERKMVELGQADQVRGVRMAFQAATADEFINAVEPIVLRKVTAFASGLDPVADVAFENFYFAPSESGEKGTDEGEPEG